MPDPISPRYATITAMMDDPMNYAIIEREMIRRSKARSKSKGFAPPPVKKRGGGVVFLTMRSFQRVGPDKLLDDRGNDLDYIADIYEIPDDGWFIVLQDGEEAGPFDDLSEAIREAESLLEQEGYTMLPVSPWTKADVEAFPL